MITLIASVAPHELNCRQARTCQEPAPNVVEKQAEREEAVEADQEVHERLVEHVDVVLPDADRRDQHVGRSDERVQDEQQEVPLILQSDAVVSEEAVVAHLKHARLAHRAVVRSCWFELVAVLTFQVPEAPKVAHGFGSVLHQSLDIFLQSLESIIFAFVEIAGPFDTPIYFNTCCFTTLAVFYLFA